MRAKMAGSSRSSKLTLTFLVVAVVFFVTVCLGFSQPILLLGSLAVGWANFLHRTWPKVRVDQRLAALAVGYVIVLVVGAHVFMRWLYREWTKSYQPGPWRMKWTVAGIAIVLLLFVSGTATVGITHQTAWLVTSPQSIFASSPRARKLMCASNLRQIGYALARYAESHGGKYPDDLATLLQEEDLVYPSVFVCPADDETDARAATTQQVVEQLREGRHCSYVYLGRGLTHPPGKNWVIAYERMSNHEDGINVLTGEGIVEYVTDAEAKELLSRLPPDQPRHATPQAPATPGQAG